MPIHGYSVLTGRIIDMRRGSGQSPHFQVQVSDDSDLYRLAINVESQEGSEVLYLVEPHFDHPILMGLADLKRGLLSVQSRPGEIALDYIRGNLLSPSDMTPLPISAPGPDNDLDEKIGQYVERAMADEAAVIHAFGQLWGPEPKMRDQYFGFLPGRGIHDIHMNQGNPAPPLGPASFFHDNGTYQDGGLIFHFPGQQQWVAMFLKFQSQAWHTDDRTGNPLDLPETDGLLRIVGALVNSTELPEREFVTLLNTDSQNVSLEGWRLADRNKNHMALSGVVKGGDTLRVEIQAPMQLSNRGGIVSVLDSNGLKVDGVSYTHEQAAIPGRTIAFRG